MNEKNYPKYRWFILATMVIGGIIQGMILISPTPIVGEIAASLKMDLGATTATTMIPFTLMVAIGGILSGFILDKLGLSKTFIVGTAVILITAILMPVIGTSVTGLMVLRGIQGFAFAPITASGPRVAAEWFPKTQRAMYQGFTSAALTLGITLGFNVSPALTATYGWNAAFSKITFFMIVSLVLFIIMAFGPKSPVILTEKDDFSKSDIRQADADFKKVFGMPEFWFTLVAFFLLSWVSQGYNDLTPGHIAVPSPVGLGLGAQSTGVLMSTYTMSFVVGSLLSGLVLEKVLRGNYKRGITVTYALTAIFCGSVMFPGVTSNMTTLTVCLVLAGFFMGMPGPFTLGFVASQYPAHITGRVGGIITGLGIFGGTVAASVGSYALHATGFYTVPIMIVVVACIIGAAVGFGVNPPKAFQNSKDISLS
jgi:MFS family permease